MRAVVTCRGLLKTNKKTDVAEHPGVLDHVGLLFNEPPGTRPVALHLVIRQIRQSLYSLCIAKTQDTVNSICYLKLRVPAPNVPTVRLIVVAESLPQRRLFINDNENMRDDEEYNRVA